MPKTRLSDDIIQTFYKKLCAEVFEDRSVHECELSYQQVAEVIGVNVDTVIAYCNGLIRCKLARQIQGGICLMS